MNYKLYEVGGKIRDEILGLPSKDIDYSVVLDEKHKDDKPLNLFINLKNQLTKEGFEVFVTNPDTFTIRAMFPKDHKHIGVADFVLARKEVSYGHITRKPKVIVGDLYDDLKRRDFTVNAIAKDTEGKLIDPFNGVIDIHQRILRTPSDASLSFNDDPLRILRVLRFMITKKFGLSDEIIQAIRLFNDVTFLNKVSEDRVRDELTKMFKHSVTETLKTLRWLEDVNHRLHDSLFIRGLWLMPTSKTN